MTRMYRVTARRGRGECQEVSATDLSGRAHAPPPAPQGKPSLPSPPPLLPPLPYGAGRGRRQVVWRAPGGEEGGAATFSATPPSLKGQHLKGRDGFWVDPRLAAFSFYR